MEVRRKLKEMTVLNATCGSLVEGHSVSSEVNPQVLPLKLTLFTLQVRQMVASHVSLESHLRPLVGDTHSPSSPFSSIVS